MEFDPLGANETDVREEFLAVVLRELGYRRNTINDLRTEFPLYYDRATLGRRKKNAPKIQGKVDYLLKAGGFARWVLEAKPPNRISAQDIDQVLSYARHPEVSAAYAGICNGREFRLYRSTQMSDEDPLIQFDVTTTQAAVEKLGGVLHPHCVARDFRLPKLSPRRAIAAGRAATEEVVGGFSRVLELHWQSSLDLDADDHSKAAELRRRMIGLEATITGGQISREGDGRIIARLNWSAPHQALTDFSDRKGIAGAPIYCLSDDISRDPAHPSIFESLNTFELNAGEKTFDIVDWRESTNNYDMSISQAGQVLGYLDDNIFVGFANSLLTFNEHENPEALLSMWMLSSVELYLSD